MYNPADIRWDILNDIMSSYYLCYYQILGLNDVLIPPSLDEEQHCILIIQAGQIRWQKHGALEEKKKGCNSTK